MGRLGLPAKKRADWRAHARALILAVLIVSAASASFVGLRRLVADPPPGNERDRGVMRSAVLDESHEVAAKAAPALASFAPKVLSRTRRALSREVSGLVSSSPTSILVFDPGADVVVFEQNADRALVPASNQKSIVGAAALSLLGPDYEFETRFRGTAPLNRDGVLDGDLVVTGQGDPTISGRFFDGDAMDAMAALADCLAEAGLKRITGRVVADTSLFSGDAIGPRWPNDPLWMAHMVEPSALVFNDNEVRFDVRTRDGRVDIRPAWDIGHVQVVNRVRSGGKHAIRLDRGAADNRFVMTGRSTAKKASFEANVHDGSHYFVRALTHALVAAGIDVGAEPIVAPDGVARDLHPIFVYHSPLLPTLEVMLQWSNNLYAELVLRAIGLEVTGEGSREAGCEAVEAWLEREGALQAGTMLRDGSGLSRANAVSARQLVAALEVAMRDQETFAKFRDALARPGVGTLRKRQRKLEGAVFAKTGTMSRISSLGGYVVTEEGRPLVFAVLSNACDVSVARRAQDRLCGVLHAVR